jgi:CheY-like chemotaxis protein
MTRDLLCGCRILIVEDEAMIALMQAGLLERAGSVVVGPVRGVAGALRLIAERSIDLALLDVNLGREKAYPVADALAERGVPFVFLTGYGREEIPPAYRACRRLMKPWDEGELLDALSDAVEEAHKTTA